MLTIADRHPTTSLEAHSSLITRRSRVQIPPPLLKALVSDLLTRASTVLGLASTGPSTGWSLSGRGDEGFEGLGSFCLHSWEDMLVGVDGERRMPVT